MKTPEEQGQVGWLDERKKDLIAGGLFLGLCLVAVLYFRWRHVPINLPAYKITILNTGNLFIFRPR